ncbi:MAG: flagellar basal-body MS-ring/collar protein FliF [Pseudomonadota bacterium]|nr:flagellar basal-body MS-ring/collar protein FliF [Pseudomonadota bacterium]
MAGESTALPSMPALPASLRPLLLLLGIAAAVAAGVWIVLWSRGPTYSLLYANLSPQQEAQVVQALQGAQIPYQLDPSTNGVEVPAEQLDAARLKLAGQGVTQGDSFAALDKGSGFGVSQFIENVRYQHALEAELAHTIASMQQVSAARVNLAVPRQSVFVSDQTAASASVFVQLRAGSVLGPEQVQAIVNLVASSVPDLSPAHVTVVDQNGQLLSGPQGSSTYAMDERNFDLVHRIENEDSRRIVALLTPLVGPGLVHADVVAELNLGTHEQAQELYKPNSQIVRSEQISQQSSGAGGPGGVPGSLSNEPPTPGVLAPPAQAKPAAATAKGTASTAAPTASGAAKPATRAPLGAVSPVPGAPGTPGGASILSKNVTRNYDIDRTLDYSRQPPGQIRRLTVAVLVGYRAVKGANGKVTQVPLSAQELTRITQLVKDAVGYNAARGDSVSVVNEPLDLPRTPSGTFQSAPLWQRPIFWNLLKIVAGLIGVIVLVVAVLRPLVRSLLTPVRPLAAAVAQIGADGTADGAPQAQKEAVVKALTHEQQLANARAMVGQDPKRVAQLVRGWVGNDE